jgi:hypothetical protein
MRHVWGGEEGQIRRWWKNMGDRDHKEDQGIEGSIILKCILRKEIRRAWTGLLWLRTGTSGGLL